LILTEQDHRVLVASFNVASNPLSFILWQALFDQLFRSFLIGLG
jgi:hypothetical protein